MFVCTKCLGMVLIPENDPTKSKGKLLKSSEIGKCSIQTLNYEYGTVRPEFVALTFHLLCR